MTNILYLKDSFDPRYINRDEVQFVNSAVKHGHNVNVATSNYDLNFEKDRENLNALDKKHIEGYRLTRHAGFKIPYKKSIFFFTPFKIMKRNESNILFVHNIGSFSSFMIPFYRRFKKPKIILKADFGIHTYNNARKRWLYRKLLLMPVKYVDRIICFTNKEREYLKDLGVPSSKMSVIPIGINFKDIPDYSDDPGSKEGQLIIGMAGRICEQKGQKTVIGPMKKLLDEFSQLKFLVIGIKAEKTYAEEFLNSFKDHKNFKVKGFVDDIHKEFMKKCDIVIIPSKFETGSILCLEAMAAGKAVIASDITPHNEYITHGKNGFLARNEDDYYDICKKLLKKPDDIEHIGKTARNHVKKFDWDRITEDIENIYADLI